MARLAALLLVPLVRVFAFRARNLQAIAATGQGANDEQRTPGVTKVVVLLDAGKHMAMTNQSAMVTDVVEGLSVGGKSQAAVGYFNRKTSGLLSGFTSDASALVASVSGITYESSTQVMPALKECKKSLPEHDSGSVNTRVCLLIMDNEFSCGGYPPQDSEIDELCKTFPDLCPDDLVDKGVVIEYGEDLIPCTSFASVMAGGINGGIKFAMAMSAKSEFDKQIRLSNPAFREFVTATTGCRFVYHPDSNSSISADPDTCQRFSFTTNFGQLRTWASQLLPRKADTPGTPQDPAQDPVQGNPAQDPAQDTSTKNGLHLCALSLVLASVRSWISI